MPPAAEDAGRSVDHVEFAAGAFTSIVAFTAVPGARHQDDDRALDQSDDAPDGETVVLRMSLRLRCQPPLVTFRFSVNVFGPGGVKTALYFDIPRHHISSLDSKTYVDAREIPELRTDDVRCFPGGAMRLCILLSRPGCLVMPTETFSLKGRSQLTLQTLTRLAAALDLVLFIPRKTLSEAQIRCLQQTIASAASAHDREQQDKEHGHWLAGLYGGVGGRIWDPDADSAAAHAQTESPAAHVATTVDDASTPSESGESTVATATPPAYRRSAATQSPEAAAAAAATSLDIQVTPEPNDAATPTPPPYIRPTSEDEGDAPAADVKGKGWRKRPHDGAYNNAHGDGRQSRRRIGSSPPAFTSGGAPQAQEMGTQPQHATDVVLYKLEKIWGLCQGLERRSQRLERSVEVLNAEVSSMRRAQQEMQAEVSSMRHAQQEMRAMLEDTVGENQPRIDWLEAETTELAERCEVLEDTHGETVETLEKISEKYESIELEIEDQVYGMVRARLTAALETM